LELAKAMENVVSLHAKEPSILVQCIQLQALLHKRIGVIFLEAGFLLSLIRGDIEHVIHPHFVINLLTQLIVKLEPEMRSEFRIILSGFLSTNDLCLLDASLKGLRKLILLDRCCLNDKSIEMMIRICNLSNVNIVCRALKAMTAIIDIGFVNEILRNKVLEGICSSKVMIYPEVRFRFMVFVCHMAEKSSDGCAECLKLVSCDFWKYEFRIQLLGLHFLMCALKWGRIQKVSDISDDLRHFVFCFIDCDEESVLLMALQILKTEDISDLTAEVRDRVMHLSLEKSGEIGELATLFLRRMSLE
jgi:hypothetical protein